MDLLLKYEDWVLKHYIQLSKGTYAYFINEAFKNPCLKIYIPWNDFPFHGNKYIYESIAKECGELQEYIWTYEDHIGRGYW